jgi:hypothetical protein
MNSARFMMFLSSSNSYKSGLLGAPLIMELWPVFILQFNGGFLINNAGGDVALITLYIYQFCTISGVLGFVWNL